MPEIIIDGEYLLAKQDDGNTVVYRHGVAVWDKWSYEASLTKPTPLPNPSILVEPKLVASSVNPIGMSYWRNINQHKNSDTLQLFLSFSDELYSLTINKATLEIVTQRKLYIHHTGEGCYFSAIEPSILFVPMGNSLVKVNIDTNEREEIWTLADDHNLWQCHSSMDETMHSATIKDGNYNIIKWGVFNSITKRFIMYDIKGEPDECQIDASGKFLIIKEDNYNRIIKLENNEEVIITNEEGALGHSDVGFGCFLGENDMSSSPGACDLIDLRTLQHRLMFSTGIWNMGYVSFTNAKDNNLSFQRCLITTPSEIISVVLDGDKFGDKICDNLTQNQDYENRPKANLCPNGEFAAWTAFVDGRLNAYIVKIPDMYP